MYTRLSIALSAVGFTMLLASNRPAAADGAANPPPGKEHSPEHMIQRFDKNNNHALEASEVPQRMWARISVADANKDGSITAKELQDAHASGKLQWHHHDGAEQANPGAEQPQGQGK